METREKQGVVSRKEAKDFRFWHPGDKMYELLDVQALGLFLESEILIAPSNNGQFRFSRIDCKRQGSQPKMQSFPLEEPSRVKKFQTWYTMVVCQTGSGFHHIFESDNGAAPALFWKAGACFFRFHSYARRVVEH